MRRVGKRTDGTRARPARAHRRELKDVPQTKVVSLLYSIDTEERHVRHCSPAAPPQHTPHAHSSDTNDRNAWKRTH
eukprot:3101281-Prymnesium_polylepis.3